ncbi:MULTISPECIES: MIP/aquaporin family protein [Methylorubrum]|nr:MULTISPECIES: aquaporin [Methylorubrum]MDF9861039.1 glycerol uptake facilitator-like aquaporin [Methylorubrum pseudosasae]MDH6640127.1 glycerol uptake facilitator-like aquaporin [Methylobacterium sp. SuP10 SLI 274]MDH6669290.1 glycerol uptake facilitator-like aquaporin [Methylorubrum zatmanii]MCP1556696.1 glycerol uptake facilitator-like aquaporin [Methylorubrum extorquens]MCY1640610.1 aquaporin [Methylorubrum sp. SL192]
MPRWSGCTYLPHWGATEDQGLKLACFCTAPAIRKPGANWLSEIIGTFMLVLIVGALLSKAVGNAGSIPTGLAPYLVGMVIWGIGLSLGGTTGYGINPARDFGPRCAHALLPIAGKGGSDWGYALIPFAAPLVGAAAAALAIRMIGF